MPAKSFSHVAFKLRNALRWRYKKLYKILREKYKHQVPVNTRSYLQRKKMFIASWSYKDINYAYETRGLDAAVERIEKRTEPLIKARAYRSLARNELVRDVLSAADLAERSLVLDDSDGNRLRNCMTLWDAGSINRAYALLQTLDQSTLNVGQNEKALQITGAYRLLQAMPEIPSCADVGGYESDNQRILYVASSSRPFHMTGYTARTHHLLGSLREQGWDVHCVTRPGYPYDRPDAKSPASRSTHCIEGVPYECLQGQHRREVAYDEYLLASVSCLIETAQRLKPNIIHAASNYEAALPALIAARRLGIKFCYEVRGLWEYTAASKKGGWEQTERFELDALLEAHTASHADAVFTLTKALAHKLESRGVPAEKIQLLPNAVNIEFFKKGERDLSLAQKLEIAEDTFVCGYIGSVVKYEGLDDLVVAWKKVVEQHVNSRLLIVGGGDELENIKSLAQEIGIASYITFTGTVAHTEVKSYFSLLNVIALPRKPLHVCRLVSPLKPFEAMAMKVPLVVSDVEALSELFTDGSSALIHKAGDSESLANALIKLAENPGLQKKLSDNAFVQVCEQSQWSQVISPVVEFYRASQCRESDLLLHQVADSVKSIARWTYKELNQIYDEYGANTAVELIEKRTDPLIRARAYRNIARDELTQNVLSAANLAERSLVLDDSDGNRLRNCMTLWDAGSINRAYALLQTLDQSTLNVEQNEKALQIIGSYRLLQTLPEIPKSADIENYAPQSKRILYVASSSRPYHMTGYTARTHHLLESLREQDWDVHCVTRPGYPGDRPDTKNLSEQSLHCIDGVPYERLPGQHRREIAYDEYLLASVDSLIKAAQRIKPQVIHAASNYEAALPALIAARRLGIKFCYEVRGLWEYTAASKKAGWEQTERFELDALLETHTASHADAVFTLTKALAHKLESRGVPAEEIQLLPNAVNIDFFKKGERDSGLAQKLGITENIFVCGYIGSVVKYEGLDDLIVAWKKVIVQHANSRLLIVGGGDELENLKRLAKEIDVDAHVTFAGRVTHNEVKGYFSLLNTIALPRKPYNVCRLVSPLKPFEAMSMQVPLVVSDVEALSELFVDGTSALIHKAGDSDSLAGALIKLAGNPELQKRLRVNAYTQVCEQSQWSQVISPVLDFYRSSEMV